MRVVGVPGTVFLLLFMAAALVLSSLLQSISKESLHFSSNPLFVFSLFNIIIVAIIVGSHRSSSGEVDSIIPFLYHQYEPEEDADNDVEDTKSDKYLNLDGYENGSDCVDDESEDYSFDSDGYNEDDDDNGSDDEVGWGDMDEHNSNLEKRIEDFIDKVNKGWKEERLRDSLSNPLQFSYL
ncbi:hypothetical protein PRUPE_5G081400 [Prunus persica]|uniref:DUF4408 domain-containing protein n=1 Tax=Prunus persica TaxID=3760 RepID=M5W9N3_PRUPE|nr:uncharacterized protein LOC18776289 [Prunus persica]ONI06794.1 hypothetical protein PRUPE_5G081400 [Prunus persica]